MIVGGSCFASNETVKTIIYPNSTTTIRNYTFVACTNLEAIAASNNLIKTGEGAFEDCNKLTIYAPEHCFAETYAKENNIKFEAI